MEIIDRTKVEVFDIPIPWLINICVDCTLSINRRNFKTMQNELVNFILNIHKRAHSLDGLPSDFVSLTAFKDHENIFGPPSPLQKIVKMDQGGAVGVLCNWVNSLKNDGK